MTLLVKEPHAQDFDSWSGKSSSRKVTAPPVACLVRRVDFPDYYSCERKSSMNQTIVTAIKEKRLLSFTYDGYARVVEPHCYGITTAGNEAIRCYQVRGGSSSGKVPDWRMMTIDSIRGLTLTQETFSLPRTGYKRGDRGMSTIFCEL